MWAVPTILPRKCTDISIVMFLTRIVLTSKTTSTFVVSQASFCIYAGDYKQTNWTRERVTPKVKWNEVDTELYKQKLKTRATGLHYFCRDEQ
jgi:hypothetical protein